jgi:hypothetical protein
LPVVVSVVATLAWACGGGEDDSPVNDLAQAALEAVLRPGAIAHVTTDEGSQVWIDSDRELFREDVEFREGRAPSFRVGEGWMVTRYDGFDNEVVLADAEPPSEVSLRIKHPVLAWLDPLAALAFSPDLRIIGEETVDGREVVAIDARGEAAEADLPAGTQFIARVELDLLTDLVVAYETRVVVPEDQRGEFPDREQVERIEYDFEFLAGDALADDFFSADRIEELVVTIEEKIERIRTLGIEPYWLGESFESDLGTLVIESADDVFVDPEGEEGSISYTLRDGATGPISGAVTIDMTVAGLSRFSPPNFPQFAGTLPEQDVIVTVAGREATLYGSVLRAGDLDVPCPAGQTCTTPDAPLYHRLVMTVGDTDIHVKAVLKADTERGVDANPFNDQQQIMALAEELTPID